MNVVRTLRPRRGVTVRSAAAWAALSLAAFVPGAPLAAQRCTCVLPGPGPRWHGEALTAGANALIGGTVAGVARAVRGGSFVQAFAKGAAGGAVTYGGKRIAAERFGGAGVLGREVGAFGASLGANAAEGRAPFSRLVFPLGPLRVYYERGQGAPVRVAVDGASVLTAGWVAARHGSRFDAWESIRAGAFVFHRAATQAELGFGAAQAAGVIQIAQAPAPGRAGTTRLDPRALLSHEQVHVVQYDQAFILLSRPVEQRLMAVSPVTRALSRHLDLGLNVAAEAGLSRLIPYTQRPWEREAYFLSRTRRPDDGRAQP